MDTDENDDLMPDSGFISTESIREAAIAKILENQDELNSYSESLGNEKKELSKEVETLEEENHNLEKEIKKLEYEILVKEKEAKKQEEKISAIKRKNLPPLSEENRLASEIKFLEAEKVQLMEKYNELSDRLNTEINNIGASLIDLDFTKGETETFRDKTEEAQQRISTKYKDLEYLHERLKWTSDALLGLHSGIKTVERNFKIKYYKR